ncbi:MAG: site-specific integrase [candidate division Zixibacteria bacterium]|nr:site-specific integrase [candidate division Zixibacteria bacterium]
MAKGSVIKRSGSWYAVYRVGGRQKWEKAGTLKRSAERILTKRLEELNTGLFVDEPKIRFSEFARKWLTDYVKVSVKESTYVSYEAIVRLHLNPHFGEFWLNQITPVQIQNLVSRKISRDGLSPKSVVNILAPLKEMFKHAVLWGYLRRNPASLINNPRIEQKEMDFLTPSEICLLMENVLPKYHTLFLTAIMTGMRRGEILGLQWDDIDWRSSQICVRRSLYKGKFISPKSKRALRRITMSPMLREGLEQHRLLAPRSEMDLVFCQDNGKPIQPDNMVKREFLPALQRAGLRRIRFHDLRHTFASLLIAQGENVKIVQNQLGHSSATTTLDRYGHLMPNAEQEAASRLDQTVFGNSVRKLLENPGFEGKPHFFPQIKNPVSQRPTGS